jgi:flagellar biosynthesis/type III secretory pathway M-ring protein FliF/YscJ
VLVVAERFSRPIVGVVGIVAALILGLRVVRTGREPRGSGQAPTLAGGGSPGPGMFAQGSEPELPPVTVTALNATTSRLKTEVQAESTQRPEMAASVVKAWLAEGG